MILDDEAAVAVNPVGAPAATPVIVMDNSLVSLPTVFSALTVKVDVPAVTGIPVMRFPTRLKPVGNEPLAMLHVMGLSPFAASVWLYGIPVLPSGNDVVVISGEPSSNSQSHPAIENPIAATSAIIPNNLIVFFILKLLILKGVSHFVIPLSYSSMRVHVFIRKLYGYT
jgi:hypothetical protein